uniref:Uncharacterized protein n=1 Tax=Glossina pallidipes TaxID=7398 RepID=A0A1B0ABK0_GLOPL
MLSWFVERLILESNIDEKKIAYYSNTNTDTGTRGVVQVSAASASPVCSRHTPLNQRWGQCKCSLRSMPHERLLSTPCLLNAWSTLVTRRYPKFDLSLSPLVSKSARPNVRQSQMPYSFDDALEVERTPY